jgi:esterase/lipase
MTLNPTLVSSLNALLEKAKSWKFWVTTIAALIVFWLAFSTFLYTQSTTLIFNNKVSWAPVPAFGYELSFVRNKAGQNISMWYFPNPNTDKVVLYLHGNAGRLPQFFPDLKLYGSVLSPAYPGYHESEGDPSPENALETTILAYDYLVNVKKVPEDKILIFGHSLGGSTATYLASQKPKAKKLIVVNTFSSVQSMCYNQYTIFCVFAGNTLNSAEYAKKVTIPVRQFVYKKDLTVPPEEGRKLFTYFKSEDKKLIEMDEYTHSDFNVKKVLQEAGEVIN